MAVIYCIYVCVNIVGCCVYNVRRYLILLAFIYFLLNNLITLFQIKSYKKMQANRIIDAINMSSWNKERELGGNVNVHGGSEMARCCVAKWRVE